MRKVLKMRHTRRKSTARTRRYRSYRRSYRSAEVKYYTLSNVNASVVVENLAVADTSLSNVTFFGSGSNLGLLNNIIQGTDNKTRIGDKIFVKKISYRGVCWMCPSSGDAQSYDTVTLRHTCHNAPSYYGGSNIVDFWNSSITSHIADYPARSAYTIRKDKTLVFNSNVDVTGATRAGRGAMKFLHYTIPVNRAIEYRAGQNALKNGRDFYCFSHLAFSPSIPNNTQVLCCTYTMRVYYTDI